MEAGAPKKSEESSERGEEKDGNREIFREAQLATALPSITDGARKPLLCGARRYRRRGGA